MLTLATTARSKNSLEVVIPVAIFFRTLLNYEVSGLTLEDESAQHRFNRRGMASVATSCGCLGNLIEFVDKL